MLILRIVKLYPCEHSMCEIVGVSLRDEGVKISLLLFQHHACEEAAGFVAEGAHWVEVGTIAVGAYTAYLYVHKVYAGVQ